MLNNSLRKKIKKYETATQKVICSNEILNMIGRTSEESKEAEKIGRNANTKVRRRAS